MLSHFWWVLCWLTIQLVSPLENYGPHIEVCCHILLVCYIYRYNFGVTRAGATATQSHAQSCLLHACSCKVYVNVSFFLRHFSNGSVIFSSFDPFLGHPSTVLRPSLICRVIYIRCRLLTLVSLSFSLCGMSTFWHHLTTTVRCIIIFPTTIFHLATA